MSALVASASPSTSQAQKWPFESVVIMFLLLSRLCFCLCSVSLRITSIITNAIVSFLVCKTLHGTDFINGCYYSRVSLLQLHLNKHQTKRKAKETKNRNKQKNNNYFIEKGSKKLFTFQLFSLEFCKYAWKWICWVELNFGRLEIIQMMLNIHYLSIFDWCQITGSQYRYFKLSIRNHFCFISFDSVDKGKTN